MSDTQTGSQPQRGTDRVRKRASNACSRCRRQKIRCSGTQPCTHCSRRSLDCNFEDGRHNKVFVSQSYLEQLERRASGILPVADTNNVATRTSPHQAQDPVANVDGPGQTTIADQVQPDGRIDVDSDHASTSESSNRDRQGSSMGPELTNPLDPRYSDAFHVSSGSRRYFLGVSSNWSFGRRVFTMVHESVHGRPPEDLLFEGCTYELPWDGLRESEDVDVSSLPTSDFALFLINAVKFHCGRLFHLFDETVFMHYFAKFYEDPSNDSNYPRLWYCHFLLILAFGKAFIVRTGRSGLPPGADFFLQAARLLPDVTYLARDPVQAIEVLCCTALYLQCLDLRSAAYNYIGQALRIAVEQGMHTDMRSRYLSDTVVDRLREVWWTVYILDRQMTALMGVPISISDDDITAPLPRFGGSTKRALALALHVKLAKCNAIILQTVYGSSSNKSERFLKSMKDALRTIAEANDDRHKSFELDLANPSGGMDRLSAYLHLFHHQALILATRPLLFSLLQKRLQSPGPLRISSFRRIRSLIRACISSAHQCVSILEVLQSQSLLEGFLPFDREATFSAGIVLVIANAVDSSLLRDKGTRMESVCSILDEMAARGNLIALSQKRELEQLDENVRSILATALPAPVPRSMQESPAQQDSEPVDSAVSVPVPGIDVHGLESVGSMVSEWSSDDGMSREHLLSMAEALDFDSINWMIGEDFM